MVLHERSLGSEDQQPELSNDAGPLSSLEGHPLAAPGDRPLTHRHRRSSASVSTSGPASSKLRLSGIINSNSRKVVYLDHVHTHQHHHFHTQGDWGVAGDLPPEEIRCAREAKAEASIQGAYKQRHESQVSPQASLSSGPAGTRSSKQASTPRKRPPLPPAEAPVGIAPAKGPSPTLPMWDMSDSDSFVNANLNSISDRHGHYLLPQHAEKAPTRKLPMPEYFSLIAALPPGRRLEFSPYSVSRSPRGFCPCLGPMP